VCKELELAENINPSRWLRSWSGDDLGIFASAVCLVHCLALPAIMSILPLFMFQHSTSVFHAVMLILIIPTTFYALWQGSKRHNSRKPIILAVIGIGFLVSEVILHELAVSDSHLLAPVGGVFLISCHLLNIRTCRKVPHCEGHC
jgi:hypothetical protein